MLIFIRNIFCCLILIAVSPMIVISIFFIFLENGLPVFFRQNRVGLDQHTFVMYKIRTMKKGAPSIGTHEIDKSYNLKIGSILRKLKIDEIPQLFNVIKGELNLIGFRPGLENQDQLNLERNREGVFNHMPGITGLAQVTGFDMSNPEKLSKIDKIYYDKKSVKLDFQILICTLSGLFRKKLMLLVKDLGDV